MNLQNITFTLPLLILILAVIYVIYYYSKFKGAFKYISWFILFSLVIQLPSSIMGRYGISNLFFLHIYVPISYILFVLFYKEVFKGFINKTIMLLSLWLFILFSIVNTIFWQDIDSFNTYALSIESLLIIIFSLSLFIFLLNETVREEKKGFVSSLIWVNSGLFIYHTSGLLLFFFAEILTKYSITEFQISWLFHSLIYLIFYICIIIGLWKYPKK
ncbi:hypothetical protein KFE94_11375 [bacterium SCSIO 12643]|nr:hypothetical protein KFE94_11375 [bacterium SCSIO 12643]